MLRSQWLEDTDLMVQPWQVANYREFPLDTLFDYINAIHLDLDRSSFIQASNEYDSPEEMTRDLLADYDFDQASNDYIYLLIFELWRRLIPEKRSLSIFCDELDYQINLYYSDNYETLEPLEDILASMQCLLEENLDSGEDPTLIFQSIQEGTANDLESFLYDFISDQIDLDNLPYASELLEGFRDYLSDPKWFNLLDVRILISTDPEESSELVDKMVKNSAKTDDVDYLFELLSILVQEGEKQSFLKVVKTIIPLLTKEQDFQDLLLITIDYLHCIDDEEKEQAVQKILSARSSFPADQSFDQSDTAINALKSALK